MSRFPAVTGKHLTKLLSAKGFSVVRQKGSHCFLRHFDERATVVPVHSGEVIGEGLLPRILKDAKLTKAELFEK
ncbi:MAG: type II toxin-antitoxin system HicA family toxin [Nitrospinae bacterium]|nr:type II toxin-antitoxin system HicA family toxin [Nitrospinota bacterium]